jgi:tetratricopeptide (TPR) repeat protein
MTISNPSVRQISSNLYQILFFGDMGVFEAGLKHDLEQAPDDSWLKRCLGIFSWKKKDFAKAEPILAEAASRFDNDPLGRFAWAESRRELGLPFDPVEIMGEKCVGSVHFATQEATRLIFRAKLNQSQGRIAEARADAEAAVAIDPRSESAWESLARVCRELGEDARAAEAEIHAERWTSVRARLASMVKSSTLIGLSRPSESTRKIELPLMHRIEELVREAEWELPARLFDAIGNRSPEIAEIDVGQFLAQNRMPSPDRYFLPRPTLKQSPEKPPEPQ